MNLIFTVSPTAPDREVVSYAMPCHAMPCYAMLFYALLCYAVLSYLILSYPILSVHMENAAPQSPVSKGSSLIVKLGAATGRRVPSVPSPASVQERITFPLAFRKMPTRE